MYYIVVKFIKGVSKLKAKKVIEEMNKYSSDLNEQHQKIFDEILLKIRFSDLDEHDAEEFSHHCLNLFLQAEKENKSIKEILGTDDVSAFCNEYITEVKRNYHFMKKMYLKIKYIPMMLLIFSFWEIGVGSIFPKWIKERTFIMEAPITISTVVSTIFMILMVYLALHYIPKISFELNHGSKKQDHKWTFIFFLIFVLTTTFFVVSKLLFRQVLFTLNYLVFLALFGTIYALQYIIENVIDRGNVNE